MTRYEELEHQAKQFRDILKNNTSVKGRELFERPLIEIELIISALRDVDENR